MTLRDLDGHDIILVWQKESCYYRQESLSYGIISCVTSISCSTALSVRTITGKGWNAIVTNSAHIVRNDKF